MKKTLIRVGSFVAVALTVAACSVALPPIDMTSWFGGDTDSLTATGGYYSTTSDTAVSVEEIPAFSRGGIGLSSITVDGGSVEAATTSPLLAPSQVENPDEIRISVYLEPDSTKTVIDPTNLLVTVSLAVTDGVIDGSSLTYVADIDNDLLTTALENETFYAGVEVIIYDGGTRVSGTYVVTIDGLTANAVLSLL